MTELFDTGFMEKLDRLGIVARKFFRGRYRGEHRVYRKGASLEFHDYRSYQPGDDFRYIDWNVYSRLDRLFVKLFSAEEDLTVHVLVDTSASMGYGTPSKLDYAKRVAAALSYIGYINLDRVRATAFRIEPGESLEPSRSGGVSRLFSFFLGLEPSGGTCFNAALTRYAAAAGRAGLAVVISDLLDPSGYEAGLLALAYAGFDVMLIQVLAEEELSPSLDGAQILVDVETGGEIRVTVDRRVREAYGKRLELFLAGIERFSLTHGIEYMRAGTIVPFEELVLTCLRQGRYLR